MARAKLNDRVVQNLKYSGRQTVTWDLGCPGFGVRLNRTRKTFVAKVSNRLVTVGHYPDDTLKDSRTEAKRVMLQIRKPSTDTESLKQVYLEEAKMRLAKSTYSAYQTYLNTFTKEVDSLTLTDVRDYLGNYVDTPTQQNYAFRSVRAFLNWCVREGHIDHHPLTHIPEPNKLTSRDRVLTDDELKAIWGNTNFHPYGYIVRALMLSGQRKSQISFLQPEWIDEDSITFPQQIMKGKEPHILPLTPLLSEHLNAPFVFNGWSKSKTRLDKASGVSGWKLHDLRRTWATIAAKEKIEPHIIERVLHHKSSGVISGVSAIYNLYGYFEEMENALLTVENYLRSVFASKQ